MRSREANRCAKVIAVFKSRNDRTVGVSTLSLAVSLSIIHVHHVPVIVVKFKSQKIRNVIIDNGNAEIFRRF